MNPHISVIINTYNYGRFIEETIESALAQDYPAERMEILVVDDGSTDDTPERVKQYEGRVRYFRKENGDQCSAITFGVAHSKGDIVAFLDGDDLWLPNKLTRVAEEFEKNPRAVMVYNALIFWDCRDNSAWGQSYFAEVSGDVLSDRRKLLSYGNAPTSALSFRKQAFQRLTNIPMDRPFSYDLYLAVAALFIGPIAAVPEPLTKYRVHGGNRHFAGRTEVDLKTIRRRIARQEAAMEIIRDWVRANAPESFPQAEIILRRWRLVQDQDKFLLEPPNRFRRFIHACRVATLDPESLSPMHRAYRFFYALAGLVVGERAHYLEGVRTRVNRLRAVERGS